MKTLCIFRRNPALPRRFRPYSWYLGFFALLVCNPGCSTYQSVTGYFNTYYNCQKLFEQAVAEAEVAPAKMRDTAYYAPYAVPPGAKGKFDKVIEKSSKLLQYYEKSNWLDDAIYMIGVSYVYKDENESAIRKFRELEENFPSSEFYLPAKLWHAKAEYFMKKDDEALKVTKDLLEEARKEGEDDIMLEVLVLEGQIYFERQDYRQSAAVYELATEISGEDRLRAFAQFQVGICRERMGDFPQAAKAYSRVMKFDPEFSYEVKARLRYGRMLTASQEYEKALEVLDELLEEKLTNDQIALTDFEIANTDWEKGDSASAFALYAYIDSVYRGSDASAKANYQRGIIHERDFLDFKKALQYYTKSKDQYPQSEINRAATQKVATLTNYFKLRESIRSYDSLYTVALHADTSAPALLTTDVMKETTNVGTTAAVAGDTSARRNAPPPAPGGLWSNMETGMPPQDPRLNQPVQPPVDAEDEEEEPVGRRGAGRERPKPLDTVHAGGLQNWLAAGGTPARRTGKDSVKSAKPQPVAQQLPLSKDSLNSLLARTKYELAGLFFLELNLPDSGLVWYVRVIDDHPRSRYVPRALYAMSEICRLQGDTIRVDSLYDAILNSHGTTEYALQVRKIRGMDALLAERDPILATYTSAELLILEGKHQEAIDSLAFLTMQYPASVYSPQAFYTIGWIYENHLVNIDSASSWYARLEKQYPGTPYAIAVHPKLAVKADPKSVSQYVKIKEIAAVPKTEAPRTARTLSQEQAKGQGKPQMGNARNTDRDDMEVDDNTQDDEPDPDEETDTTTEDPDDE